MGQAIFITGTDTGAGKTLLTALLLLYLRQQGHSALATKPFCTGSQRDVDILSRAQDQAIPVQRVNPFFFPDPVAPLVAARRARRVVAQADVLQRIRALSDECDVLLVEGAGGLLVPLGEKYSCADLIAALRCPVLVAVRNRLGAVNHALLTVDALRRLPVPLIKIVLLDATPRADLATQSNAKVIAEIASPLEVIHIPFLGRRPEGIEALKRNTKKLKKTLAEILQFTILSTAFRKAGSEAGQ